MFSKFKNEENNWENGVTLIPGAEEDPSPDNNVHIITNSSLSPETQITNTAHEAYGHAYFYELKRQGYGVNPFHKHISVPGEAFFDSESGLLLTPSIRVDANTQLDKQIRKVVEETLENIKLK